MAFNDWQVFPDSGLEVGMPYAKLNRNLKLLEGYFQLLPQDDKEFGKYIQEGKQFLNQVAHLCRKPIIALSGPFDAGKSTLANSLLGRRYLSTDFAPMTAIPALILHQDDRPKWIRETVWIMNKAFNPLSWNDEQQSKGCLIERGNYDLIKKYSHDGNTVMINKASMAIVFVDSPILHACSLIDYPGFENDDADTEKAKRLRIVPHVAMYLCPFQGFLRGTDMIRVAQILRGLPALEASHKAIPPLFNIYLVASHADPQRISPKKIEAALSKHTSRLWTTLSETFITERARLISRKITKNIIGERIFGFSINADGATGTLVHDVIRLLKEQLPHVVYHQVDTLIAEFKSSTTESYAKLIDGYTKKLEELSKLEEIYQACMRAEPDRQANMLKRKQRVLNMISSFSNSGRKYIDTLYGEMINKQYIERLIREKYNDKQEAQEYAAVVLMERFQEKIKEELARMTSEVQKEAMVYLEGYQKDKNMMLGSVDVGMQFDEVAAFMTGLVGLTALGGLASIGAGLGGSWLAVHATGALGTIGTWVGYATLSTAQVLGSALSIITGPVGITVVATALLLGWLFGKSWQEKLAEKICDQCSENDLLSKLQDANDDYWNNTRIAFETGSMNVEKEWKVQLSEMEKDIESPETNKSSIEKHIDFLHKMKGHWEGLPWGQDGQG